MFSLPQTSRSIFKVAQSLILKLLLVVGIIATQNVFLVQAQTGIDGWAYPEVIGKTTGNLANCTIAFFSDQYGDLHLLYTDTLKESKVTSINYIHWHNGKWAEPVDVIANEEQPSPNCPRAILDADTVHLIWNGANNNLLYQSTTLSQIASPTSWTPPQVVASAQLNADIVAGKNNALYIAYGDTTKGDDGEDVAGRVALIYSTDGGKRWEPATTIAQVQSDRSVAGDVRLAIDESGRIHAVWNENSLADGNPLTGVFYSRSTDNGKTWQPALQVAGERHGQIGVAAVGADQIHLVWRSNIGGDGTFHQVSLDGGSTWLPSERFDDQGGMSGLPSFVTDSNKNIHFVIGLVKYGQWNQQTTSYLDVIPKEIREKSALSGGERGTIAITNGNRLHIIFETEFRNLWHTTKQLAVPPIPTAIAAPPTPPNATRAPQIVTPTIEENKVRKTPAVIIPEVSNKQPPNDISPNFIIAASIVPVILLIGIVVLVNKIPRRRR